MAVKPIPEGYHSVTPYIQARDASTLLTFLKEAFDARERLLMPAPGDKIGHAEIEIGDSLIMMADLDVSQQPEPTKAMFNLYVEDVDKTFQRALDAGAQKIRDLETMFYGDRSGAVLDPAGNMWWISTHVEDVPPEEMERRSQEALKGQG